MILKTGDRICQIDNPKITGAVVGGGRFGKESEVMVRWDSVYYYSEFPYSFPKCKYIRKLTKLERVLK